jgi:hypothetical protein
MSPSSFRSAVLALLAIGCSTETGVLIEVTREETVPADLNRLAFYVGVDRIQNAPSNYADLAPEQGAMISGRDLMEDPYRLMLRQGENPDASIMVAVLAFQRGAVVGFGALDEPVPFVDGKVTLWSVVLGPELPEGFVITEDGCLRYVDGHGTYVSIGQPGDLDCDGYIDGEGDCNDLDPGVNAGSNDTCGDGVDQDCDQAVDEDVDDDGDLVTTCGGDCDDGNTAVFPGAEEICDGVDNDCNQVCDDGHDGDGDRYSVCGSYIFEDGTCLIDEGKVDCDDGDDQTNPGAAERCDGADNNCDGTCDEDPALDRDGDHYTECGSVLGACGVDGRYVDCQPDNPGVFPGQQELCNGVDDDCDGNYLETAPCFARNPDDGTTCGLGIRTCVESAGSGEWGGECQYRDGELDGVPGIACDTYESCDAAGDADPFRCAAAGGDKRVCDVNFEVGEAVQCQQREVVLPTGGLETCSWHIAGGAATIGDYQVGLRPLDVPAAPLEVAIDVCDAVLQVQAGDAPPAPAIVILVRDDGVASELVAIDLVARPQDTCNPPDGLVCSGLTPPSL